VADAQATMGMACTHSVERMLAAVGLGEAPMRFEAVCSVSFGGVLCALPALAENGLFDHRSKLPGLPEGYYTQLHILLLLAFMALCRIRTVEQLRYQPPGELGKLMGLDRIPEVRTLREKMALLSNDPAALAAWGSALSEQWMERDPEAAGVLFVDGHVRVYHGELALLPRRYVSRERLCLRGTTDYWVNDWIAQPYFVVSQELNDGLIKTIREEIVPRLLREVPSQPSEQQLWEDPRLHRFLLVFDREGSSPAFFKEMWEKHRIACVSYRKGPLEDWEASEFVEQAVAMPRGDVVNMTLAERGTEWGKGFWVREIRKRSEGGHQTSIITTAYRLEGRVAAACMFSRWSQENFFKYMMQHYELESLVERGAEAVDETKSVINPAWRQKDAHVRSLRQHLVKRQAAYAAVEMDSDLQTRDVQRYQARKTELGEEVEGLEGQLGKAREERRALLKHVAIKDLPEPDKFKRLLPARKQFMDTMKMIAYRAETGLCALLRDEVGRLEDVRPLLRDLFRHDANLLPDPEGHCLTVEIHHMANPQADAAIAQLLEKLNSLSFTYPGTNLLLHYKLVS
jgi:prepilin-type processing-associated H-X9-DG protein